MKEYILRITKNFKQKSTIETDYIEFEVFKLLQESGFNELGGFEAFTKAIRELVDKEVISPVLSSGKYRRGKGLFVRYRISKQKPTDDYVRNLKSFHPEMIMSKYHNDPKLFNQDEKYLRAFDNYLKQQDFNELTAVPLSINERSYQIFREEKYLTDKGKNFLSRISYPLEKLNCIKSLEPFMSFNIYRGQPILNVLIVENLDTYYSLKRVFKKGLRILKGIEFSLLIFGEGNKITNSFQLIEDENINNVSIRCWYFGDLDRQGIEIYGSLCEKFRDYSIVPMVFLYQQLLDKYFNEAKKEAQDGATLKNDELEKQQRLSKEHLSHFLSYFEPVYIEKIQSLVHEKKRLAQEGLNFDFFSKEAKALAK